MNNIKTYEAFVDKDGKLQDLSFKDDIYYPYNELKPFIDEFQKNYGDYTESQGWAIFDSDTENPNDKYDVEIRRQMKEYETGRYPGGRVTYNFNYWQIEKLDGNNVGLNSDEDAYKLAEKLGVIVDELGVVRGFDGNDLVEKYNS